MQVERKFGLELEGENKVLVWCSLFSLTWLPVITTYTWSAPKMAMDFGEDSYFSTVPVVEMNNEHDGD